MCDETEVSRINRMTRFQGGAKNGRPRSHYKKLSTSIFRKRGVKMCVQSDPFYPKLPKSGQKRMKRPHRIFRRVRGPENLWYISASFLTNPLMSRYYEQYTTGAEATSFHSNNAPGLRLLTKRELANALGVSPRTIDLWISSKKIPYRRFSERLIRFNLRNVMMALDQLEPSEARKACK